MKRQYLSVLIVFTAILMPVAYAEQEQPSSNNVQMLALCKEKHTGLKGLFKKVASGSNVESSEEQPVSGEHWLHPLLPNEAPY